ncbi:hypothetical protein M407DRAFT_23187 [Tulasnella calospora MUT 4182]|uniref:Uncharacterized protein n=1 Tax=Tulasnella calospora MUT 4182 TaxID=1051891 RepID=A0A0C3M1M4_9AGAM|nr:hypothetical protein M407DRAFT_23187 [Tulasnella calospora MUT 4182]
MSERKLRSGKKFNPFAGGHSTASLDVEELLQLAAVDSAQSGDLSDAVVLAWGDLIPTSSSTAEKTAPHLSTLEDAHVPEIHPVTTKDLDAPSKSEPLAKTALQAKRTRERARKKLNLDRSRGKEADRRAKFVARSLEVAHQDFILNRTLHSKQGYVGIPDGGQEWGGSSRNPSTRLAYLRDVGGYTIVDTTIDSSVDYPFVDSSGRVWAVVLAEPPGWEARRAGIEKARSRLSGHVAHLKVPPNRRGDFRSYQFGFSHGMGRIDHLGPAQGHLNLGPEQVQRQPPTPRYGDLPRKTLNSVLQLLIADISG